MDINTLRGIATILVMAAFLGVVVWVFVKRRRKDYDEAANLPFADEEQHRKSMREESRSKGDRDE